LFCSPWFSGGIFFAATAEVPDFPFAPASIQATSLDNEEGSTGEDPVLEQQKEA
jgi:hypothetical protein